jgi:predicted nucleic acid-binding protein
LALNSFSSAYVFDAFALHAYLNDEPGAGQVEEILDAAAAGLTQISVPMFNVGETIYKVWRLNSADQAAEALNVIESLPVSIVHADYELVLSAASLKAELRMGYLDCFPAALAMRLSATVVTGDSGFEAVEASVRVHWLPRA